MPLRYGRPTLVIKCLIQMQSPDADVSNAKGARHSRKTEDESLHKRKERYLN